MEGGRKSEATPEFGGREQARQVRGRAAWLFLAAGAPEQAQSLY